MKPTKGKLDEEMPVTSFLLDTSYCMKFVDRHIFYIVNYIKAERYECTKVDSHILNKSWGNMIKNNGNKSLEEL